MVRHADIIRPCALRAPEVIISCECDGSADIWNLGCLVSRLFFLFFLYDLVLGLSNFYYEFQIFELLTGRWLFVPRGGLQKHTYHLAHMPGVHWAKV